jgi:hypothetical protein
MLETQREEIWLLHLELPRNYLVAWTSGNVSGQDHHPGLRERSGLRGASQHPNWLFKC